MEETVIVLGMARSGTSMIAGILHYLGVYMCNKKDLARKDRFNEKSYFENREFWDVMNKAFGQQSWNARDTPKGISLDHIESLKKLIKKHNKYELWGFKEPKTCYFIKYIWALFRNPKVIIIHRSLESVQESFFSFTLRVNRRATKKHYEACYRILREFVKETRNKHLWFEYEEVLENPKTTVKEIVKFLELNPTKEQLEEAIGSISKDLCHWPKEEEK